MYSSLNLRTTKEKDSFIYKISNNESRTRLSELHAGKPNLSFYSDQLVEFHDHIFSFVCIAFTFTS